MSAKLDDLSAYLGNRCSPELERQLEAEAADPNSPLSQFFAGLRDHHEWACTPDLFTPTDAQSHSTPSEVVAKQKWMARVDLSLGRWKWPAVAIAAFLAVATVGGGTAYAVYSIQKSSRSSRVLSLVNETNANLEGGNRTEAARVFSLADSLASDAVSDEARAAVAALRREMGIIQSLNELYIRSNREWPNNEGIKSASDAYKIFFQEVGLFDGTENVEQQAASIKAMRSVSSYLIAGIDHWLSVIYLLPEPKGDAERIMQRDLYSLARHLQKVATRADERDPSRTVRKFLVDEDPVGLAAYFETHKTSGLHPETVGQVTGFLLNRGDPKAAFLVANDAWWDHPTDATINGFLAMANRTGVGVDRPDLNEALHFYSLCVAADPNNGVYWANLAQAYRDVGKPDAWAFALKRAFKINPKLPVPKPPE